MQRPEGKPSGYQNWRELLFVHWTFEPAALRALVPPELELDLWEGRAYAGIVPFAMEAVRPALLPRVFAMDFLETNVRTYVTCRGEPGVFFFSLEAASLLAVKAARWGWGLPYHHAEMSSVRDGDTIAYATTRHSDGAAFAARYTIGEHLGASEPGTLEHFLLERYLLFTVRRDRVSRGQVAHVPYPAQRVTLHECTDSLLAAAGLASPDRPPELAHYAAGVDVEVFGPHELAP